MKHYYVNDTAQPSGDNEVHEDDCHWLSLAKSKTYLGYFEDCKPAVRKAKKHYKQANGCIHCSEECHTS